MEIMIREILTQVKGQKLSSADLARAQKAFELVEDVEGLAKRRGMVYVKDAIRDGYFPKDVYDVDYFSTMLLKSEHEDYQVRLEELFLAKMVYDQPVGIDAFIDYMYYRTSSYLLGDNDYGFLSQHFRSLLPKVIQNSINLGDFQRKSCFKEFEEKRVIATPECQELTDPKAIASRKRLEEYLERMDNHSIQRTLREVRNDELSVALKGCHVEMAKLVMENETKRMRAMLVEDMKFMGTVKETDIAEAMDYFSDLIEHLEKERSIYFQ